MVCLFTFLSLKLNFMKRILLLAGLIILVVMACNKSSVNDISLNNENAIPAQRTCAANDVLEEQMKQDPSLRIRMNEIEAFTQRYIETAGMNRLLQNGIIEIPVVVNVLYNTAAENISDAQINSQITVLNKDFSATNSDYNNTPAVFQPVRSGDIGIRFVLDQVNRKQTNKKSWQANDQMKKNQQGGIDPTSPTTKLNIWVCNLSNGILGYAQFPGGNAATDGVVIDNNAMGTEGTATAPYNKGRTATHEIGHWMNLRHIWGDTNCGTDYVDDTPPHKTANFGCPGIINLRCTSNSTTNPYGFTREMTMNYMDYTDDACMYIFTGGQKTRMLAVFAPGGPRNSFAQ